MNISERQADYVAKVVKFLALQGFRVKSDLRNEKIGFKIREHTLQRVPYQLIIGDRELENQTLSVRTQRGEDLGSMSLAVFAENLQAAVMRRGRLALEE
jgi:translation initiation factor IF-3